jgi:hypothetical protein
MQTDNAYKQVIQCLETSELHSAVDVISTLDAHQQLAVLRRLAHALDLSLDMARTRTLASALDFPLERAHTLARTLDKAQPLVQPLELALARSRALALSLDVGIQQARALEAAIMPSLMLTQVIARVLQCLIVSVVVPTF